ncbi:MAG: hypothetical protein JNG84_00385 [Archangium sp.]|nr:hypothetical protein [Archangium sp.]
MPVVYAFILLAVTAAAPSPRALPSSASVFFAPRIDRLSGTASFFGPAGASSAVLRPEAWRDALHPLGFDALRPESVKAVGIDPAGPLTLSQRTDVDVSCVSVADAAVYQRAMEARLQRLGTLRRTTKNGVVTVAAVDALGRVVLASVTKGRDSCAVVAHGATAEPHLVPVAALLGPTPVAVPALKPVRTLPGTFFLALTSGTPNGVLGVTTQGPTATAHVQAIGLPLAAMEGPGTSPFAAFSPAGLGVVRLRLARASLAPMVDASLAKLPLTPALRVAATTLAPALTGNVALFIHRVQVTGTLRTAEGRFSAVRAAVVAEVADAALAKQLVDGLDAQALGFRGGTLRTGVTGTTVVLANDVAAYDAAVAALGAAPRRQAHAVEFDVQPQALARGLSQVPLLDAVQDPALAGVLAAGTELGPLLLASERLVGWLDAAGAAGHRAELTWRLRSSSAVPDGGVDSPRE